MPDVRRSPFFAFAKGDFFMKRNRWGIALAAVGIHISIGSVYAWSVLTRPVMEAVGATLAEATWAFSIAIFFLGLSAAFLGHAAERMGPRRSGLLSMLFFTAGLLGTAWAVERQSLALLYFFYGFIGGIGLGTGYITPVATLVKWFPRHRGFATGLAIMGFGFAAFVAGPVMQRLTAAYGLAENFLFMACAYALVMGASALYLAPPRPGEVESDLAAVVKEEIAAAPAPVPQKQYTRREAVKTPEFAALWWIFFTNITCGIGLLAVASPMAQEVIRMSPAGAASLVGIIGIVNGAGRILWSTVSDWIGRGAVYLLFFTIEVFAFWQLAGTSDAAAFAAWVLLIISCYGGGFSCMPAYLSDLFGVRHLSSIHGVILTAWGMAGLAGPLLLSVMKSETGGYGATLRLFAGLLALAWLLAAWLYTRRTKCAALPAGDEA